ncbi:Peptide-O-fucosyltransferase [Zostera marina]|uniref:O-fucosyltransferase family protein n=1 Tax=Zostera marina TaxID=29655 RepID=A0A0K9NVW3_ZOSMR|nr:Peptide-O-fucosyltransferase [Zostera marina]
MSLQQNNRPLTFSASISRSRKGEAKMAKSRVPFSSSAVSSSSSSSSNRHPRFKNGTKSTYASPFSISTSQKLAFLILTTLAFFFFSFVFFPFHSSSPKIQIEDVVDLSNPTFSLETKSPFAQEDRLWDSPEFEFRSCTKPTKKYKVPQVSDHYITVRSNGGLNQMRTGISDMVSIARMMNATLVIPQLDKRSFWQDSSLFSDVFDEPYFIKALEGDVRIIKELPKQLASVPRVRKHFTTWGSYEYYQELTALFKDSQVLHAPKSDSRLANNDLPVDIQRLRCRTLYNALRFSAPIENLGKKLVERLKLHGRYIALHLRYEKDMLAFTGCTYGLTDAEAEELKYMRENTKHWKLKNINSTEQRIGGFCPLTPKEVGVFLHALGFASSTWIYVAAGQIYGGSTRLSDLKAYFPNLVTKDTLATPAELKIFSNHESQNAALDYIISVESDVFIPSYSGNMARAVEGHRRFLGHRKTINPDRKGLVEIFERIEKGELQERESLVSSIITQMHKSRQGAPRKRYGALPGIKGRARFRTEESFYENPFPECICKTKKTYF